MAAGCGNLELSSQVIPDGVESVAARGYLYAQDDDHPLWQIEPGTVIDDLSGLDGCWAGTRPVLDLAPGDPFEGFAEYMRFDLGNGVLVREVFASSERAPEFVLVEEYSIESVLEDRVRIRLVRGEAFVPVIGALTNPEEGGHEEPVLEVHVTLDGDELFIPNSLDGSFFLVSPFLQLFRRVECVASDTQMN